MRLEGPGFKKTGPENRPEKEARRTRVQKNWTKVRSSEKSLNKSTIEIQTHKKEKETQCSISSPSFTINLNFS
jgi:hypothetical protein